MKTAAHAFLAVSLFCLVGCSARTETLPTAEKNRITQVSIVNALLLGEYDGEMTIKELLHYGDFGLGTCDHLDGELIVLDGKAYQARSDGTVNELALQATTPFAVVTPFENGGQFSCSAVDILDDLEDRLDEVLTNHDLFFAIRIDGRFDAITLRSVPRQEPPYAPLAEVAKQQGIWNHQRVQGTLVGFRCPKWVTGLNVPGYHWHFLSSDHKFGGHVLACQLQSGTATYDRCDTWLIKLGPSIGADGKDLSTNLSRELKQIETHPGKQLQESNR